MLFNAFVLLLLDEFVVLDKTYGTDEDIPGIERYYVNSEKGCKSTGVLASTSQGVSAEEVANTWKAASSQMDVKSSTTDKGAIQLFNWLKQITECKVKTKLQQDPIGQQLIITTSKAREHKQNI